MFFPSGSSWPSVDIAFILWLVQRTPQLFPGSTAFTGLKGDVFTPTLVLLMFLSRAICFPLSVLPDLLVTTPGLETFSSLDHLHWVCIHWHFSMPFSVTPSPCSLKGGPPILADKLYAIWRLKLLHLSVPTSFFTGTVPSLLPGGTYSRCMVPYTQLPFIIQWFHQTWGTRLAGVPQGFCSTGV